MQQRQTIGWIGFGKMGRPMAERLGAAGHRLAVFDPRPEAQELVRTAGMEAIASLSEIARQADVIFSSLPDDRALLGVAAELAPALSPQHLIVETSTVSPAASAAMAEAIAARGAAYLRAPVSGSTATAEAGALSVLASGTREAFERAEPLLSAFSQKRFHVGAGEEARYLKLVLNTLVGATSALVAEALTLGRKGGLDVGVMLDVISQSAVASPLIDYKRRLLETNSFEPAFSVAQMMKDFDLILSAARDDHCPMYLSAIVRQQYEAAFGQGQGEKDFFVLYEEYAKLAGL